jgi:hypothetical protein
VIGADGVPEVELADEFFKLIASAGPVHVIPEGVLTDATIDAAGAAALEAISIDRERRERDARQVNDATVDAQLESLRSSHERRRDDIERRRAEATDRRIQRLYDGQLRNRQHAFERKVAEIEAKRAVVVSSELVAAGLLVVDVLAT